jgi:parallel beta-helix repeat protein
MLLPSLGLCALFAAAAPDSPLELTVDTVLDPTKTYGPIAIRAPNITVDGRGAVVSSGAEGAPKTYKGVGISAKGVSGVKLRNVRVRGFEIGLKVDDGSGWTIEGCDVSDNFHDPDFGWGENGRRGGIVLTRVAKSVLRRNRAQRNWDACSLDSCDENIIEDNDFSRASNTCLKLWTSSRNVARRNNLSYGIRISPGEVHARDSAGVLIESGSDHNRFLDNDCTHGGDGIFIRVLNGWVSTGNHFEGNDCSWANNNAFEAWSPRNTYVRNKANHSSYGFWLGASDQTVLIGNEAAYNGDPAGIHNSPHLPGSGHAGIVFMFGPSSHTLVDGNHCHHNNGAGIALIGDQESRGAKFKAFHWIVQRNRLEANRWGVYVQHADWVDLAANTFISNRAADVHDAGGVTNLTRRDDAPGITQAPKARLAAPDGPVRAGETVAFDASASSDAEGRALRFRWDLGDGTTSTEARVEHVWRRPGFYRLGLTVENGLLGDLAWRDVYVVEAVEELGEDPAVWDVVEGDSKAAFTADRAVRIAGDASIRARIDPYGGARASLRLRTKPLSLDGRSALVFWLRARNPHVPAWQGENPVVALHDGEAALRLVPRGDFLSAPPYNEAREGWTYFVVPLAGDERWKREGSAIAKVTALSIGVDSWGAPPIEVWLDGIGLR